MMEKVDLFILKQIENEVTVDLEQVGNILVVAQNYLAIARLVASVVVEGDRLVKDNLVVVVEDTLAGVGTDWPLASLVVGQTGSIGHLVVDTFGKDTVPLAEEGKSHSEEDNNRVVVQN